jgi:hypothetical protein
VNATLPRFLALALGACVACEVEPEEQVEKRSAGAVSRAVEQLRSAPNEAKAARLAELRQVACANVVICQARDLCADAYAEHVEGVALTGAARLQIEQGKDVEAAGVLIAAEQKLQRASERIAHCTDHQASLRRRYKL